MVRRLHSTINVNGHSIETVLDPTGTAARDVCVSAVLICAPDPFTDDLHGSLLWRNDIDRYLVTEVTEALVYAVAVRPDLIILDRSLAGAELLVRYVRQDSTLLHTPIVVLAGSDRQAEEIKLLAAGANAVVRTPLDPRTDVRLLRLVAARAQRAGHTPRAESTGGDSRPRLRNAARMRPTTRKDVH